MPLRSFGGMLGKILGMMMLVGYTQSVIPAFLHALYALFGVDAANESREAELLDVFLKVLVFLVCQFGAMKWTGMQTRIYLHHCQPGSNLHRRGHTVGDYVRDLPC